jgi:hypothetical protein
VLATLAQPTPQAAEPRISLNFELEGKAAFEENENFTPASGKIHCTTGEGVYYYSLRDRISVPSFVRSNHHGQI